MDKTIKKNAFTIIELIVVIAVIGILVLLATPKFLGYTQKATLAQVKSEIVANEKIIEQKRVEEGDQFIEKWQEVQPEKVEELKGSMFNKKGLLSEKNNESFEEVAYYKIPGKEKLVRKLFRSSLQETEKSNELVKTNLPGDFYVSQGGKVFYYDEKLANKIKGSSVDPDPTDPDLGGETGGDVTDPGPIDPGGGKDPVVPDPGPTEPSLDDDFEWIPTTTGYVGLNGEKGYFRYKGTGKTEIKIPNVIQGVTITSYYKMFLSSPEELTKVSSDNATVTDMSYMFNKSKAPTLDVSGLNSSKVTSMKGMFSQSLATSINLTNFNTSNVTNMYEMFEATVRLKTLDLSSFNTAKVTDMGRMFYFSAVTNLDLRPLNTSSVTNMSHMFFSSKATSINLTNFNTSNVMYMEGMFESSSALNLNLSSFNTSKVTTMENMFFEAAATSINLSSFDTSNVIDMIGMFRSFQGTTLDLSSFRTPKVRDFGFMFYGVNLTTVDLSTFDTSTAKRNSGNNFRYIFQNSKITKVYANTQTDADNFNSGAGKPPTLTIVPK